VQKKVAGLARTTPKLNPTVFSAPERRGSILRHGGVKSCLVRLISEVDLERKPDHVLGE
jgi:hypothetical protein